MSSTEFDLAFDALTGNAPFPWQRRIYERFTAGDFPRSCNLPTGLGKTAIIPIWLIALASGGKVPRRLVYVVNRRTVFDQATREAEKMRDRLRSDLPATRQITRALRTLTSFPDDPEYEPLAISTLRGQFADNGEWRSDPARPAVVVGTVDMIGSRLLFAGYGCGFRTRPLHAGYLGQDVLLVHDEAQLEPAFQQLVADVANEQTRCREFGQFHVMELTATSRGVDAQFQLNDDDQTNEAVRRRVLARKRLVLHPVDDVKKCAEHIAQLALRHQESGKAILVFVRKLEDVEAVAKKLGKDTGQLTGTLRGWERDRLAKEDPVFLRFMPVSDRPKDATLAEGTVYLICTSAGEVGINISADHLVCDLTPFDSMAQRFGRVNRFGDGDAQIDVVYARDLRPEGPFEERQARTLQLLQELNGDASPAALRELPQAEAVAAYTPPPEILATSEVLFDAWALTTVREQLPGRPPVADWLHGVDLNEPPATYVAWREEVEKLRPPFGKGESRRPFEEFAEDLLEDYPLKPHELLRDQTRRIAQQLDKIGQRHPDQPVWVVRPDDTIAVFAMQELVAKNRQNKPLMDLANCTVILAPSVGGLRIVNGRAVGILEGAEDYVPDARPEYDIADRWSDERGAIRKRVWDGEVRPSGMRLIRTIKVGAEAEEAGDDESAPPRQWHWFIRMRSAEDESREWSSRVPQDLMSHLTEAERYAEQVVRALDLAEPVRSAVILSARHHDRGKGRKVWQRGLGNTGYDPDKPGSAWAKSGHGRPPEVLSPYRHEFGSLLDLLTDSQFQAQPAEVQDLVLHLVGAHHGRARPHFPTREAYDPERGDLACDDVARDVPRRFARLQRKYGRWGLAYLESLVRSADILASAAARESNK